MPCVRTLSRRFAEHLDPAFREVDQPVRRYAGRCIDPRLAPVDSLARPGYLDDEYGIGTGGVAFLVIERPAPDDRSIRFRHVVGPVYERHLAPNVSRSSVRVRQSLMEVREVRRVRRTLRGHDDELAVEELHVLVLTEDPLLHHLVHLVHGEPPAG